MSDKNTLNHIEITQKFIFEGVTIIVKQSRFVLQPNRETYFNVIIMNHNSKTDIKIESGTAFNFILEKFQISPLWKQIVDIKKI